MTKTATIEEIHMIEEIRMTEKTVITKKAERKNAMVKNAAEENVDALTDGN
jgi:hypothetical protein